MDKKEQLEIEAQDRSIDIQTTDLPTNISGLYYSNGKDEALIAINRALETRAEQACVLAEELGHYYTSYGDLLTESTIDNTIIQHQENRAKRWAIKKLVSIKDIIEAYDAGCQSIYEMAEYLEITEDFLKKALKTYADIYGVCQQRGNYIIYFDPPAVLKLLE